MKVHEVSSQSECSISMVELTSKQVQSLDYAQNRLNRLTRKINSMESFNIKLNRLKMLSRRLNRSIKDFKMNPREPVDETIIRITKKVERIESMVYTL